MRISEILIEEGAKEIYAPKLTHDIDTKEFYVVDYSDLSEYNNMLFFKTFGKIYVVYFNR